jgi:membrane associated rhomboid family serine protease
LSGIHLPRGRFTDALIAFSVSAAIVQLAPAIGAAAFSYGFAPPAFMAGALGAQPLVWLAPLVSQFLLASIGAALFNTVLTLIAGRYVEQALGGAGLAVTFVAGAYGGAIARLALTPNSPLVTAGMNAGFFAVVGAYLMLYGIPGAISIVRGYSRPLQIAALAAIWVVIQIAFMLAGGAFELSVSLIDPLGGLLVGALLARPLLAWRYRKA